jgi:hypothetical protein
MIREKDQFTIQTPDVASAQFTLKDENLAHVFQILRSNLYSDKILAVIREYSTNAYDANKNNGVVDTPIQVTIPTHLEPTFQVRDFGKGLSEQDVFGIYASYGASTKRESNEYVGTLGMGSKSGFAYAPSFTVTSYHEGVKKVYEAYIDETNIGTIAKMHEEESSEPSGICVKIDVSPNDIRAFRDKAYHFFKNFSPMPKFFGVKLDDDINYELSTQKVIHSCDLGVLTANRGYSGSVLVKMGNVCYPLLDFNTKYTDWIRGYELVLNVEIGDVSFTTSRESLEMNKLTTDTVIDRLEKFRTILSTQYQSVINAATTPWAAICAYHKLPEMGKALLGATINWNGTTLATKLPQEIMLCQFMPAEKKWRLRSHIDYNSNVAFIVNDGGYPVSQLSNRLSMAREQLIQQDSSFNIKYAKCSITESKALLDMKELEGVTIVKLSTVMPKRYKSKKTFNDKETIFLWNKSTSFPYSSCWTASKPKGPVVYVNIAAFKPIDFSFQRLARITELLKNIGIEIEIYGVKKGQAIQNGWVPLEDYLQKCCKEWLNDSNHLNAMANTRVRDEAGANWLMRGVLGGNFSKYVNACRCPKSKELLDRDLNSRQTEEMKSKVDLIDMMRSMPGISMELKTFETKVETTVKSFKDTLADVLKSYPLIDRKDAYGYRNYPDQQEAKHIVDYINSMHFVTNQAAV